MNLSYQSTRGGESGLTASQAILKGLADDGGLFMPVEIPKLDIPLKELYGATYQETAYQVMKLFFTDFTKHINRRKIVRWDTAFVAFEMAWIFALGFVPDDAPPQICQVAVNFIASMQFNTFRQAKKIPMATTFCTNHVRQVGSNLVKWLRSGNKEARGKMFAHLLMIGSFVAGAVASTFLCGYLGGKTIWCADILLAIVFFALLRADLGEEHDKLDVVPHGH